MSGPSQRPPLNTSNSNSPLSPQPRGDTPVSFRTNVNRAKTKRWVEAKKYTYDGDDWGEDEYGEYEYDDEPPVPQVPRTGTNQTTPETFSKETPHPPLPSTDHSRSMERSQTMQIDSPASPASIIRPADIYKRMREEQVAHQPAPVEPSADERTLASGTCVASPPAISTATGSSENAAPGPPHDAKWGTVDKSTATPVTSEPPAISLPGVKRLSTFGTNFFSEPEQTSQNNQDPASQPHQLQHNPSLGFRSAVNQAFDVPETPSTVADSVARSDSASTAAISPIIARNGTTDDKTPTIQEEPNESTDTPTEGNIVFKPGHRRDLSVPSPGNSPSRRPNIAGPDASASSEFAQLSSGTPAGSPLDHPPSSQQEYSHSDSAQPFQETSRREMPAPLNVQTITSPGPATSTENIPVIIPTMSTENSPEDTENDRLRKEIIRSLSRENTPSEQDNDDSLQTIGQDNLFPREYEGHRGGSEITGPQEPEPATSTFNPVTVSSDTPSIEQPAPVLPQGTQPKLKKRFSWEESSEDEDATPVTQAQPPPMPGQFPYSQDNVHRDFMVAATNQHSESVEDAGDRDEPVSEKPKLTVVPPSTTDTASIPSSGYGQEPTFSQTTETPARAEKGETLNPEQRPLEPPAQTPSASIESGLLGFKDILGIQSPGGRIQAFDRTRDQFAAINTGLSHWVQVTVHAHPEHTDVVERNAKPLSDEFKNSVPRAKFPKLASLGSLASSLQDGSHSSSSHIRRPSAPLGSVRQNQGGKDFLHTAGLLGGQAGKAARGLFSKGRSRLKGAGGTEKGIQSMRGYHRPVRLSDLQPDTGLGLDLDAQALHDPSSSRPRTTDRMAMQAQQAVGAISLFSPLPVSNSAYRATVSSAQQAPAILVLSRNKGSRIRTIILAWPIGTMMLAATMLITSRALPLSHAMALGEMRKATRTKTTTSMHLALDNQALSPNLGPSAALAQKLAQNHRSSQVSLSCDLGDAQPHHLGGTTRRRGDRRASNLGKDNLFESPLAQREAIQTAPAPHNGRPTSTPRLLSPLSPKHDWSRRPEQISSSQDPASHRISFSPMEKLKNAKHFRRISMGSTQPYFKTAQSPKKSLNKLTGLFSRTQHRKSAPPEPVESSSEGSTRHYLAPVSSRPDSRIASSSISSVDNPERPLSLPDGRNTFQGRHPPPEGYFAHESPETFSVANSHSPHLRGTANADRMRLSDPTPMDPGRLSPRSPPYHSPATPQRQPHVSTQRLSSPLPLSAPRTPPSRGRTEERTYAQDLHLRSRSPKAFAPRPEERDLPKHDPTDPAFNLGAFRLSNPRTSRVGDQELPWKITIPGDDDDESTSNTLASWRQETEGVLNETRLPTYQEDEEEHGRSHPQFSDEKRGLPNPPGATNSAHSQQPYPTPSEHPHRGGARAINASNAPVELPVRTDDNSDEEIMMSSTAYPGQEWRPLGFSEWEEH